MNLLDTDTCVAILRGNPRVIERRAAVSEPVATSWVTAAELFYGAAKSAAPVANRALVDEFLDAIDVLGPDRDTSLVFGEAKALLERAGQRLADADLFIASLAVARGATIVTGNRRHFERIPGLRVDDWLRG